MLNRRNLNRVARIGVAAACGAGVFAWSANATAAEPEERVDIVWNSVAGDAGAADRVGYYQFNRDGKKVEVSLRNGAVTSAKVDGEEVPAERVKLDDKTLTITDAAGGTIFTHDFTSDDAGVKRMRTRRTYAYSPQSPAPMRLGLRALDPDNAEDNVLIERAEPPAVMIGVQMASVPDALRGHLNLGDTRAVYVTGVHEGLPAHNAGIRPYDVIVSANGSDGLGELSLRERLADMKPGDTLNLTVIQKGERKNLTVSPIAYDAEAFKAAKFEGIAAVPAVPGVAPLGPFWSGADRDVIAIAPPIPGGPADDAQRMIFRIDGLSQDRAELERKLEEILRRYGGDAPQGRAGPTRSNAEMDAVRERMERMERMMQELLERQRNNAGQQADPKKSDQDS